MDNFEENKEYIKSNISKLSNENIKNILVSYREQLDLCEARKEKQNIGTFLFVDKMTPDLATHIRRSITYYLTSIM